MGKAIHRLLSKDLETKTGVCAVCGPVRLKTSAGKIRCRPGSRAWEGRQSAQHPPIEGVCPLCDAASTLVWDHDHSTGDGRGYICPICNTMLGFARDRPEVLRAAADYLEKNAPAL